MKNKRGIKFWIVTIPKIIFLVPLMLLGIAMEYSGRWLQRKLGLYPNDYGDVLGIYREKDTSYKGIE